MLFRIAATSLLFASLLHAHDHHDHSAVHDPLADAQWSRIAQESRAGLLAQPTPLPPARDGVADLSFSEFFKPVGPRGLEYSPRILALNGKRVRLSGYMVRQQNPIAGLFLLTAFPVETNEQEYGLCDDLPPAVVHVLMPDASGAVPLTPGRLVVTGTLELQPQLMPDGRTAIARLRLDRSSVSTFASATAAVARN